MDPEPIISALDSAAQPVADLLAAPREADPAVTVDRPVRVLDFPAVELDPGLVWREA